MNISLILILLLILFIRFLWYFYIKDTGDLRFFIPFIFELLFIYPYIIVSGLGLSWSFLGLTSFYIMTLVMQVGFILSGNDDNKINIILLNKRKLYYIVYSILILMVINLFLSHNNLFLLFSNIKNIFIIANENAVSRYSGNLNISILYKITTIFSFLLAFIIGSLCAIEFNKKNRYILVIYVFLLFIDSIMMAARAGLLLQSIAMLSSFISFKYIIGDSHLFKLSIKKIIQLAFIISMIFCYFLIVQVFRGGKENFDILSIMSHILTWFIGYIPGYDVWFNHSSFELTFGARTFSGIADLLNINQRVGGVYTMVNIGNSRETNIFTAFRGLIEDFSIVGAYIIMFITSFLLNTSIKKARKTKNTTFIIIAICIMYFYFWFFVINPFIYNTIIVSIFLYLIISKIFFRVRFND